MPEFIMDRDGEVNGKTFEELSPLVRGYIEAMLFTETASGFGASMVDWETPEVQEGVREGTLDGAIPGDAGFGDIHPDSLEHIIADCGTFHVKARDLLRQAYERDYDAVQAGRDFWFTRNGHGVGFWDRKQLEEGGLGDALSDIAREFGDSDADFIPDPDSPTGYGFVHLS